MMNFLGMDYTGHNKLTHEEMNIFLYGKNHCVPDRVSFSSIKKEDILKGRCLIVKDELNQIIAYANPRNIENLLSEIQICQRVQNMDNRRKETISRGKRKFLAKL